MASSPSTVAAAALLELRIKDFAIIDELTLTLEDGLNVLAGPEDV